LILLAGDSKTGKSFRAAEFTGDQRVGRSFWLDLAEGCADEYGAVPGADYEILDHNGTWVDIIGQVEAVRDVAREALAKNELPVCLVIDSMTAEWSMLSAWTDTRARRSKANRAALAQDPDAEIDITANYWNDANSRHNRLMNILKTFPGIVVLTAVETEKTQFGPGGKPIAGAPKVAKPDAQKRLTADVTAWIRLSLTEEPVVVGIRSLKHNVTPGKDKPEPWADFTLANLVFDFLGINAGTAQVRNMPVLDADQVAAGEDPDPPASEQPGPRPVRTPEQNAAYAKAGLAKLLAAGTVAAATEVHQKAKGDPVGAVRVYEEIGEDRREILGITPEQAGITLADLGYLVVAYVGRRGMSVAAALDAVNGGTAAAS
jgi:hypothetical protein